MRAAIPAKATPVAHEPVDDSGVEHVLASEVFRPSLVRSRRAVAAIARREGAKSNLDSWRSLDTPGKPTIR